MSNINRFLIPNFKVVLKINSQSGSRNSGKQKNVAKLSNPVLKATLGRKFKK